jgi:hypothetical protein
MNNQEILEAIITDKQALNLDDLVCLKNILPTSSEKEVLQLYNGDPSKLNAAESFMLSMCKEPNVAWMVDALIFELQFPAEIENIKNRLLSITSLLNELRESPGLKTLLRLVLELGNLANYDYGRVPAHMRIRGKALGFTMDSLIKLHEVKSVDRKTSLLNYLVSVIEEKCKEILTIPSEFLELSVVKHWDSSALFGEVSALRASLNQIMNIRIRTEDSRIEEFQEIQKPFLSLAKAKLEKIDAVLSTTKETWKDTAMYLGEDPEDKKPEELFIVLDQFFRHFKEAQAQNLKFFEDAKKREREAAFKVSLSRSRESLNQNRGSGSGGISSVSSNLSSLSSSSMSPSPIASEIATEDSLNILKEMDSVVSFVDPIDENVN